MGHWQVCGRERCGFVLSVLFGVCVAVECSGLKQEVGAEKMILDYLRLSVHG